MLKRIHNYEPDIQLNIQLDHIRLNDLPEIALLYKDTFAEHFLGHMDQDFLKLFCSQFMNSPTNFGYVAKCKGKPVGFLLGTTDNEPFYKFYRQNFMTLFLSVMKRYLIDSYIRKHILKRFGHIIYALKALLLPSKGASLVDQHNEIVQARLLAIGVEPKYRGFGIANRLTSQFCADMKREGFKKVGLSVFAWNERAVNFYKKDDWIQEESDESSSSFCFSRYL
ncbi:MAG: GNAT family N-acetyltransferase [Desulfosporosinus sp.]|nr:GNAT family N-acetyltransferase [Desulfosporosinus sp.]